MEIKFFFLFNHLVSPLCLNVYPTFLSPLIFGIGSLNTKWGILYQHQYAPAESGSRLAGPSLHIVEQLYT